MLGDILGADLRELYPEIMLVYEEDRVDPQIIGLGSFQDKWNIDAPPPEKLPDGAFTVLLRCTVCGRQRNHIVEHVFVDAHTARMSDNNRRKSKYDPHVMDHKIICPKCGSIEQYKVEPITVMKLLAKGGMVKDEFAEFIPDTLNRGHVRYVQSEAFGRLMHPLDAVDKYRERIKRKPKDANNYFRLGNLYRTLWRKEETLETYRQAYALSPHNVDICIALAMAEHDFGSKTEAKRLYQETSKLIPSTVFLKGGERAEDAMAAVTGLKALEEGNPSPYSGAETFTSQQKASKRNVRRKPKMKKKKRRRR